MTRIPHSGWRTDGDYSQLTIGPFEAYVWSDSERHRWRVRDRRDPCAGGNARSLDAAKTAAEDAMTELLTEAIEELSSTAEAP